MNNYFDNFYDWWKNIDKYLLFLIIGLFFLGLFFSLVSTSLIASDKLNTNSYYFFLKHSAYISLGISILILFIAFSLNVDLNTNIHIESLFPLPTRPLN